MFRRRGVRFADMCLVSAFRRAIQIVHQQVESMRGSSMSHRRKQLAGGIVFSIVSVFASYVFLAASAHAATPPPADYTVNTIADGPDANPGDSVCDANTESEGDQCTLRAAIQETNADPGSQQIAVPGGDGPFTLTTAAATASQEGTADFSDQNSDLDITDNLTLTCFNDSEGAFGPCNVDGAQQGRVFDIHAAIAVTFDTTTTESGPDAS
ncbi:MAG: hypothetical protein QOF16_1115, partial [Actinomycetota bacterium]|nr:hypothetical protein [Actinomycetota bacterium]